MLLMLPRISLASACLLTVGVSLAWGVQSHSSDPPPPPSGPASTMPGEEPPSCKQAATVGVGGSSRGVAPIKVEPIALGDVSVDSEGIVRIGRDGVFSIEAHPTGSYVRVHDVEARFVNEKTPAAGYDVGIPRFNVLADGGFVQHEEALLLHNPNNPVPPDYTYFEHPPGDRAGQIRVVGGRVTANSADGFTVDIRPDANSEGGVVYQAGGAHNTKGFEAACEHGGCNVEYQVDSGGGPSITMKALGQGSLVSPARHLATYFEQSEGFKWSNGKITLNTFSLKGEVAYGGPHHGFGAITNSGGQISYAADDDGGGDVYFFIKPHFGGTVVSGPHAFGAHLAEGYVVEYKGGNNNNANGGGGGDSFKLYAPGVETDGQTNGIASGRHGFAASCSYPCSVKYHSGESFSIDHERAGTVLSGAHGFAAYLDNGGSVSYQMVDNSFELSSTYEGEVLSQRLHHFSAKLTNGGKIKHFGDELGKFTVEVSKNGEVTYGGGGAGNGGKDEEKKKNVRVQLHRPIWSFEQLLKTPKTGSITHERKNGFVVEVKDGQSTVIIGTTAIDGSEQQQVVQFNGAGTVSFDSSGVIISKTGAVKN